MSTWTRLREHLGAALRLLLGARRQRLRRELHLRHLRATLALLALLRQSRTLRQVQAVHQLAALLPREQMELVNTLALQTIPQLPSGSASPRSSASRRTTARSTSRRRRRR